MRSRLPTHHPHHKCKTTESHLQRRAGHEEPELKAVLLLAPRQDGSQAVGELVARGPQTVRFVHHDDAPRDLRPGWWPGWWPGTVAGMVAGMVTGMVAGMVTGMVTGMGAHTRTHSKG